MRRFFTGLGSAVLIIGVAGAPAAQAASAGPPPPQPVGQQPALPPAIAPALPGQPVEVGKPGLPGKPGEIGKPGLPGRPAEPGKPGLPGQPIEVGKPGLPGKPAEPGKPGQPVESGKPGLPGKPGGPEPEQADTGWGQINEENAIDRTARVFILSRHRGTRPFPADRVVTLRCMPVGGTHPRAAAACRTLATVRGNVASLNVSPSANCTRIYDPVTVTAVGIWDGRQYRLQRTFGNPCMLRAYTGVVFQF
ncbi:hypothetical protein Sru01_43070 [Sphaerisporangium rufum]|uniref:Subtilisin inhibitor domain-containing protein n=1 Tax=Sphaerisporangium rufum TaxID=1381558 RepID=A0A919R8M3_9ACTN|nr:SSI family serine proteinase inhibitor [Sphaerisporangium rufum]GII79325.1 hypothetical protein Sru01_43070 [Sphaerisporangium rufum]